MSQFYINSVHSCR